jgi:hypothetical protein
MQWIFIIFVLISVACLVIGLLKSSVNKPVDADHYCSSCGWTTEYVKLCQVEKGRKTVIVPLCFECAMKQEALPEKERNLDLGSRLARAS